MTFHIFFFLIYHRSKVVFITTPSTIIFKTWSSFEMLISGILHQLYAEILHFTKIFIIYLNYIYVVFPSDILGEE